MHHNTQLVAICVGMGFDASCLSYAAHRPRRADSMVWEGRCVCVCVCVCVWEGGGGI